MIHKIIDIDYTDNADLCSQLDKNALNGVFAIQVMSNAPIRGKIQGIHSIKSEPLKIRASVLVFANTGDNQFFNELLASKKQ